MATTTPWGKSQWSKQYGRGIICYSTSGHGGFHVSASLNKTMAAPLRNADGWYEEDCEWAKVAIAFPDRFTADEVATAKQSLKGWNPDEYEAFYGEAIPPGESYIKDERLFAIEHANDLIAVAAWGDWHPPVPKGMVGVCTIVGGRKRGVFNQPERYFLIPAEEYEKRSLHGFIVDPAKHQEIEEI